MAGYSGTALVKKLGIRPGMRVVFINPPKGFDLLEWPETKPITRNCKLDVVLAFEESSSSMRAGLVKLVESLAPGGMIWLCWPKKASRVATDLSENLVRDIGLASGLVDVKVCAVDEIWSGLKFVYRLKDRPIVDASRVSRDPSTRRRKAPPRSG